MDNGYMNISNPNHGRLSRDVSNKWIGGVCAGLARTYNLDLALVRILFVLSMMLPGPQVLLYLVLWVIMPRG